MAEAMDSRARRYSAAWNQRSHFYQREGNMYENLYGLVYPLCEAQQQWSVYHDIRALQDGIP